MGNSKAISFYYSWVVVGLLWVVALLNYLDRILITSMRDPIVNDLSITDTQFGLLTSVFLWSYGLLSPLGGFLADKYSRKIVIIFSVLIWSAATLWTGFATSYYEMLFARAFMGISEACYIPGALALITDYHKSRTRSLATGIHMSGLYAGLAMGGMGGYFAEWWGWRFGFKFFGLFGLLYSAVLFFILKEKEAGHLESIPDNAVISKRKISISESMKALFSERSFIILLIFFCVYGMSN